MNVIEARLAYEYMVEKEIRISEDKYIKQTIDEENKQKTQDKIDEIEKMLQIVVDTQKNQKTQDKIDEIEKMLQQLIHKKSKKHKRKSEN